MQRKFLFIASLLLLSLFFTSYLFGQRPFSEPIEGERSKSLGITIGDCKMSSMAIKYRLSTLSGEPVIYTNVKWEKSYSGSNDCLSDESFEVLIRVTVLYEDYIIPAGGSGGLVPKGDNKWGYNPLSGSPDWDELFMKPNRYKKVADREFVSVDKAKALWKAGNFRVTGIILLHSSGEEFSF